MELEGYAGKLLVVEEPNPFYTVVHAIADRCVPQPRLVCRVNERRSASGRNGVFVALHPDLVTCKYCRRHMLDGLTYDQWSALRFGRYGQTA